MRKRACSLGLVVVVSGAAFAEHNAMKGSKKREVILCLNVVCCSQYKTEHADIKM